MADEHPGEIEPIYLTLEDVLELYVLIIGATAAEAADHLRNRDGLESALARPATYAHYEDADLALQAAVLAHGIAEGQLFIDGNKRTALVAMLTFLETTRGREVGARPRGSAGGLDARSRRRLLARACALGAGRRACLG
jgi:death-on-curing family protein